MDPRCKLLADAFRVDLIRHEQADFANLGCEFDAVEEELSRLTDMPVNRAVAIAHTFWDSWIDQVQHGFGQQSQGAFWSKTNGGTGKPSKIEDSPTCKHLHYDCPKGKNVDMYIVKDQGHAWPGGLQGGPKGDEPSKTVHATDLMWDFFKQQSR